MWVELWELTWNRKNHPRSAKRASFLASGGQRGPKGEQSLPVPGHSWNYRLGTSVMLNHTGKSFCQGHGPAVGESMEETFIPSPGPGTLAQQWERDGRGKDILLSPPTEGG